MRCEVRSAKQSQFASWKMSGGTPNPRSSRGQAPRRAQGQSRKTNPIRPEPYEGQVLYGTRVMLIRSSKRLRKNKANLGRDQVSGVWDQRADTRYPTPGLSCQTNPIRPGRDRCRRAKDAKRTQFPATPGGTRLRGRGTRGKCAKQDARDKSRGVTESVINRYSA